MRGKLGMAGFGIDTSRITPAGAGKTPARNPSRTPPRDHPRRCGENGVFLSSGVCVTGSPPQVRGKQQRVRKLRNVSGITPAGAGKTVLFVGLSVARQDHPRRCGENVCVTFPIIYSLGSPPQVRGKPQCRVERHGFIGITPAGAGKTWVSL